MAQDDKSSGGNLPVAGIVALVLFASGLWVQHQPLQSDRPGVELKQQKERTIHQDVEARLWQDPLEAVKRAETADAKAAGQDAEEAERRLPATFLRWISESKGKHRLIMPVLVFGGPYAEDAEQRRRTRYAVLSGLREAYFEPDTSRSIGYIRLPGQKLLIPFEKWEKNKSARTHWEEVYVLWIAEESLGRQPVARLGQLLDLVVPQADPLIDVTVLGPASYRMATDVAARLAGPETNGSVALAPDEAIQLSLGTRKVRFIAPHLSFSTEALARQIARDSKTDPEKKQEQKRLQQKLDQSLQALRLGPDDTQLARQLMAELANRGLHVPTAERPGCDEQVALVVEADTRYARSLAREFNLLLKDCRAGFKPMVFHYFRGLDGKVAQDDADSRKSSDSSRDKSKQESTPYQERAQGQGQFDYLRRIADELRRRSDQQLRAVQDHNAVPGTADKKANRDASRNPNRGAVRAVIVLGSDIHDKLAILHALRETLPQTLFATTDLDAGLLQKEQLPWTRNLIVAAAYDLTLPPLLQKGAPPFRDTYQTASYLATQKVLTRSDAEANAALVAQLRSERHQVRLFEIGNTRAVPLSAAQAAAPTATPDTRGSDRGAGRTGELFWSVVAMLTVFGIAVSWCVRQLLIDLWQRRPYAIGSVAAAAAALVYLAAFVWIIGQVSARAGEEPLSWFDGVSVWPAALIRNVAGLLAVVFFFYGVDKLRKGERVIEAEFFQADVRGAPQQQALTRKPWSFKDFQATWFPATHGTEPAGGNRAYAVWLAYKHWGYGRRCCLRVLLGVVAVLGLIAVMLRHLGFPTTPVRGAASTELYMFMVTPSFILMIILLVWTLDRVALCSLFLRRLYGSQGVAKLSGWSTETQNRICGCDTNPPAQPAGARPAPDDADAVQSYIDLRLSARISRFVGGIIAFPFVLCLMLIVARARYFDNWGMTLGFLAIILMILLLVTLGAFTLRHNAERIRRYTVEQLEALEVRMRAEHYRARAQTTKEQVALMKSIAMNLKEGAFAPLASQPIVRAILLPFGGAGLVNLLDYLLV